MEVQNIGALYEQYRAHLKRLLYAGYNPGVSLLRGSTVERALMKKKKKTKEKERKQLTDECLKE